MDHENAEIHVFYDRLVPPLGSWCPTGRCYLEPLEAILSFLVCGKSSLALMRVAGRCNDGIDKNECGAASAGAVSGVYTMRARCNMTLLINACKRARIENTHCT